MGHLLDKTVVFLLCTGLMVLAGIITPVVVGMLVAVSLSASFELPRLPLWARRVCPLLYCAFVLFVPSAVIFLPLAAGDLFRLRPRWLGALWLLPLVVIAVMPAQLSTEVLYLVAALCLCGLACLLSWRSEGIERQQQAAYLERDAMAKATYDLELKNRDLLERQELERKLATMDERSRIAREIHDNVGHLLTRSILQIKALAIVHKDNEQLTRDLEQVGETLGTAFETVRRSVHDLHEEASGLQPQLEALARQNEALTIEVEFRGGDIPSRVSATLLSIVREAISNTQRHSDATRMTVSVVEFPGMYQLIVLDNGSVDPGQANLLRRGGLGLASMEERTRALGGIFRTSYDKGFKVLVTIPREVAGAREEVERPAGLVKN